MNTLNLGKHISAQFNLELQNLRNHVLSMGGLVERQLELAIISAETRNSDSIKEFLNGKQAINSMACDIDLACNQIIVKRQPTASDLRLIMMIVKIISALHRMGDACIPVADIAIKVNIQTCPFLLANLKNIGWQSIRILSLTLDCFARNDAKSALLIYKQDDKFMKDYELNINQLISYIVDHPSVTPNILHFLWATKSIRQIAYLCKNISEFLICYALGVDIRYLSEELVDEYSLMCN